MLTHDLITDLEGEGVSHSTLLDMILSYSASNAGVSPNLVHLYSIPE